MSVAGTLFFIFVFVIIIFFFFGGGAQGLGALAIQEDLGLGGVEGLRE